MTAQHYTLNMITIDGWKEHIGSNFTSRQQAEAHGQYLLNGLRQVYKGYEVHPAQRAGLTPGNKYLDTSHGI